MTLQIYGQFKGNWSHARVSRGIVAGLWHNGIRDMQVCTIDRYGGYEHMPVSVSSGCNPSAPVGFYIGGYPPQVGSWMDDHEVKIGLFITESSQIPALWALKASEFDLVAVPSKWARDAYVNAGVKNVAVVHHGLAASYCTGARAKLAEGPLRLLHIAGARDFLDRKGTPQLIEAFVKTFTPEQATLTIRTPPSPYITELCAPHPHVVLAATHDTLSPAAMREYLCAGWSALVQPSRAEAFGMLPLEARAVGLPVICTHSTGHAEHAHPTDTVVRTRSPAVIKVNGIPNGLAPRVTPGDIVTALHEFVTSPHRAAPANYHLNWSWAYVCRDLAERVKREMKKHRRAKTLDEKLYG
jgi:hypothetical protein